ncbi:MAG TPA: GTPase domain-containing protein [Holophagaceae bacterium]|nr:GTPase domain-containing protein [Holophagaceae bacterium]
MVFFNHATRQMTAKIVYYGPGLCGKTTNLNTIYGKTSQKARGEMVSLNTETDRTLFFDLLPMDVGMVGGFKTKLQLYTVPGQVFYNSTRKLVLKGVDGIVFVVDSQTPMLDACKESFQNLQENMAELGLDVGGIPLVFQWNKRDLKNVLPVEELERTFNPQGLPSFQAVAADGSGVFETLRGITKLALGHIKAHHLGETAAPAPPPPAPAAPAAEALDLADLPASDDIFEKTNPGLDISGIHMEAPDFPEPPAPAPAPAPAAAPTMTAAPAGDPTPEPAPASADLDLPPSLATRPVSPSEVAAAAAKALEAQDRPAPRATPVLTPKLTLPPVPKAAPSAAKPSAKPASAAHLSNLLGELTQVGKLGGAPSVLRLELPEGLDGDIEVVVQVKAAGAVVAEKQLERPVPAKGIAAKVTVELKRG